MSGERTPLLRYSGVENGEDTEELGDHHHQFCHLVGTRPITLPPGQKHRPHPDSLYSRAISQRSNQKYTYMFTATLTNTLILSQVVLGATLTGLGASRSSPVLVTIFGAANTIIAGLIAWLKSRGQPMRARMFKDDLERVVDEIENSAVMWLGISRGAHGYDAIDTDEQVTVRSEVARLTRLYDRAVKTNTLNDPDTYSTGAPGDPHSAALRARPEQAAQPVAPSAAPVPGPLPPATPAPAPAPSVPAPAADTKDPDASPASKTLEPVKAKNAEAQPDDKPKSDAAEPSAKTSEDSKPASGETAVPTSTVDSTKSTTPAQATSSNAATTSATTAAPVDPDESPASSAKVPTKHTEDTSKTENGGK